MVTVTDTDVTDTGTGTETGSEILSLSPPIRALTN
jgi:hypothetical protein